MKIHTMKKQLTAVAAGALAVSLLSGCGLFASPAASPAPSKAPSVPEAPPASSATAAPATSVVPAKSLTEDQQKTFDTVVSLLDATRDLEQGTAGYNLKLANLAVRWLNNAQLIMHNQETALDAGLTWKKSQSKESLLKVRTNVQTILITGKELLKQDGPAKQLLEAAGAKLGTSLPTEADFDALLKLVEQYTE